MGWRRAFVSGEVSYRLFPQTIADWYQYWCVPPDALVIVERDLWRYGDRYMIQHPSFPAQTPEEATEEQWTIDESFVDSSAC